MVIAFGNYYRPSECMSLRKKDVIPPVAGISRQWSFLSFPSETGEVSKTGETDVSIVWDNKPLQWMTEAFASMTRGEPTSKLWPFTYDAAVKAFSKAGAELEMAWAVPYMMRHAGPSWDMLTRARPLQEIQKRGQWKATSSLARYEKLARVPADELTW